MAQKFKELSYPFVAVLIAAVVWQAFVWLARLPDYFLPLPTAVAVEVAKNAWLLLVHGWVTTYESIMGFLVSVVVGFPIALIIVWSRPLERSITPLLVFTQTFPKIAIAPLFIIWFGFGVFPKVVISFLVAFFPIVISSVTGLKAVEPDLEDLVRSMGASELQKFVKIRIPNSLPYFFSGAKVSVALAVVGAVVGEFVASEKGLGYLILVANNHVDTKLMFAGFVGLMIIGALLYFVVDYMEKICISWHASRREQSITLTTG